MNRFIKLRTIILIFNSIIYCGQVKPDIYVHNGYTILLHNRCILYVGAYYMCVWM